LASLTTAESAGFLAFSVSGYAFNIGIFVIFYSSLLAFCYARSVVDGLVVSNEGIRDEGSLSSFNFFCC